MLRLTRFQPDPTRSPQFLACLWQGAVPAGLVLREWLHLPEEPGTVLLLWDGDESAAAYVERTFGGYGRITTQPALDGTAAMAACLARDLDGFEACLAANGMPPDELARQIDLRRRGRDAPSQEAAAAAGAAWAAEQGE